MTTLKDAVEAIENMRIFSSYKTLNKENLADELLGKYKDIIPKGKTSSGFIRELRDNLYGKIRQP